MPDYPAHLRARAASARATQAKVFEALGGGRLIVDGELVGRDTEPKAFLPAGEMDDLATALEVLAELAATDPVEESALDLVYRCRHCGQNGWHTEACAWRRAREALERLEGRAGG